MISNAGEFKPLVFTTGEPAVKWKFTLMGLIDAGWFYTQTFKGSEVGWKISDEFDEILSKHGAKDDFINQVKSMRSITAEHFIFISNAMFAEMRLLDVIIPRPQ